MSSRKYGSSGCSSLTSPDFLFWKTTSSPPESSSIHSGGSGAFIAILTTLSTSLWSLSRSTSKYSAIASTSSCVGGLEYSFCCKSSLPWRSMKTQHLKYSRFGCCQMLSPLSLLL